ncbi:MAG TPA: hypothetical protein VJ718_04185 [Candidatus Binataceae bacterium]|nr:hypothetical protein [Candidatus Binataceae bacterium]
MTSRIRLDRYVYEDIYPAFKAATDEKEITAALNRNFLNFLAERNLVLAGDSPVAVADIGCGPCDTLIKYLTGVLFPPGFVVRATDYIDRYADSERGDAVRTLTAARSNKVINLAEFSARAGNAFGGELSKLLAPPRGDAAARRAFSLVYASHVLYHADGLSDVRRLIADVADNLLAADGICILFHIANTPGTFQEFRARFGSQAGGASASDTGAVTIDDPPAQIAVACASMGLPLYQMEFEAKLRFGSLGNDEWRAFKDPRAYEAIAQSNGAAYEDLKRLYFVVQRAPAEFATDDSATGLKTFLDDIRQVIESNRGALPLAERIQVFTRADTSLPGETIADALAAGVSADDRLRS